MTLICKNKLWTYIVYIHCDISILHLHVRTIVYCEFSHVTITSLRLWTSRLRAKGHILQGLF